MFFILIIIIISIYLCVQHFKKKESFQNILLTHWLVNEPEIKVLFLDLFRDAKHDNLEIYTEGTKPDSKNKNTLYVQYSGESSGQNFDSYDINFVPDKIKNNVIFPFGAFYTITRNLDMNVFSNKRTLEPHSKFCLFSVSNPSCEQRNQFFHNLSLYKQVDSCGKVFNNMECPATYGNKEYTDMIGQYKFMICFENLSKENYFTEKLINAYYYKTIPIYWGCPNLDYINLDSILYLKPDYTHEDEMKLIETIKMLDNDDDAYKRKYESIFFKNGIPDEFNVDKLREKVNKILV
jgi:hypothetical protein